MKNRINKEDLQRLIDFNRKLTRTEISEMLNISESLARTYKGILENKDVLFDEEEDTERRVLVIGDLHAPFIVDGYLEFCVDMRDKYGCTDYVMIGDIVDNHFSSYHETDADGHSAAEELRLAKEQIREWHMEFPEARVCLGNHDLIPNRKAMSSGVSSSWVRPIGEVLDTPTWIYAEDFNIDGVLYTHGVGRQARQRSKNDLISVVQGHWHSKGYVEHFVGLDRHIWAMQVGCGIDRKAYAMAYGKHFDKPHISCGVVLEDGTLPILEYMRL